MCDYARKCAVMHANVRNKILEGGSQLSLTTRCGWIKRPGLQYSIKSEFKAQIFIINRSTASISQEDRICRSYRHR